MLQELVEGNCAAPDTVQRVRVDHRRLGGLMLPQLLHFQALAVDSCW